MRYFFVISIFLVLLLSGCGSGEDVSSENSPPSAVGADAPPSPPVVN